jgi:hypothetical protein
MEIFCLVVSCEISWRTGGIQLKLYNILDTGSSYYFIISFWFEHILVYDIQLGLNTQVLTYKVLTQDKLQQLS